jgi:peroxiredoxin
MSHAHRESCLVFVGDAMPDATLPDGQGQQHRIDESCGQQLTAILFWNERHPYALDQFRELQHDLVPFHPLGVATIAIHVGESGEEYAALCEEYGRDVLCLLDPAGEYFRQVSTGSVPRVYLLDAARKVIWLDIEYSRTTRYELRNAMNYALQDARSPTNANDP